MSSAKIVITGMGAVSPLGTSAGATWNAMKSGQCAISEITTVSTKDLKSNVAAEIKQLPDIGLEHRRLVTMDRFSHMAVLAADEAARQAGLDLGEAEQLRAGAIVGVGSFGGISIDEAYSAVWVDMKRHAPIFTVPKAMPGAAAGQVSMHLGLKGPVFGISSACSSSNHAIGTALDILRSGRADIMLAGGADAPLIFGVLKAWEALRVVAPDVCRPFSANRNGLSIGEGAGMFVLETEAHAKARGANIICELAGFGMTGDASDIVAPGLEGPARAMQMCLADAGLNAHDIGYVNAHGTATKANDAIETSAIKMAFGAHARALSISSTKSMHAHCMGASGAIELIACIGAVREGVIAPTINYETADPECDLDVTPNVSRERKVTSALSNSFAFGGTNAVLCVKTYS
ncbi:MAG: beta-ketoacyl-[acyl-carrier-protein] synthase family protein [Rhizobiaceae bacterium]